MSTNTFKILSIDGGGIRGVIPGMILAEIEKRTGKPISELFNLISGTSTGGILAAGLTLPKDGKPRYSAADLVGLYEKNGGEIFKSSWFSSISSVWDNTFDQGGIEKVLLEYFKDIMLSEALTQVLVTTYDIESRSTFYFNSRLAKAHKEENFFMRDVARCTSAAPTYFEPKQLEVRGKLRAFVDGGVFANNPSVLAYVEAKRVYQPTSESEPAPDTASREFSFMDVAAREIEEPFFMLSLGTGTSGKSFPYKEAKDWGLVGWVRPIVDILMQGTADTVHYQMRQLLPPHTDGAPRYVRLNTHLKAEHSDMADASAENIAALKVYADKIISDHSAEIDQVCKMLV